jgi:hypothetical protein
MPGNTRAGLRGMGFVLERGARHRSRSVIPDFVSRMCMHPSSAGDAQVAAMDRATCFTHSTGWANSMRSGGRGVGHPTKASPSEADSPLFQDYAGMLQLPLEAMKKRLGDIPSSNAEN